MKTLRLKRQKGASIVFACVGNDHDLRSVTIGSEEQGASQDDGAFAGMEPNAIFVDHTTASAEVARELCNIANNRGLRFLDAPVSGGQAGAENGVLTVMMGERSRPMMRLNPQSVYILALLD